MIMRQSFLKLLLFTVVHAQINRQAAKTDRQTYMHEYFMGSDINEHSEEANYMYSVMRINIKVPMRGAQTRDLNVARYTLACILLWSLLPIIRMLFCLKNERTVSDEAMVVR